MTTPHEQMREAAWQKAFLSNTPQNKLAFDDGFNAGMKAQQALAATPEPAPMVRLTTADIQALRDAYAEKHMTFLRIHRGQCVCMPEDLEGFALEVQAAVIAKNRGKV